MPFMTVNIAGDYTLEGLSGVDDGVMGDDTSRNAVFGFTTKTATAHMEDAVAVINGACAVTDVAVDTPLDITGGCAGLGAYPIADCPADYDIVKLTEGNGSLGFGLRPEDNNMCTEDKRPTSFLGGAVVAKQ